MFVILCLLEGSIINILEVKGRMKLAPHLIEQYPYDVCGGSKVDFVINFTRTKKYKYTVFLISSWWQTFSVMYKYTVSFISFCFVVKCYIYNYF